MRITGGNFRGRPLSSPVGESTRPTSDRVREAIFNILHHAAWRPRNLFDGGKVLDVFAGTGALGLEALSHGADHAVFIEKDRKAARTTQANIDYLQVQDRTRVLTVDATLPLPRPPGIEPRNLVFLDPPYGFGMGEKALHHLAQGGWLESGTICVLEMAKKQPEKVPAGFTLHNARSYGIAEVMFLEWP